jgi:PKD repeat protein
MKVKQHVSRETVLAILVAIILLSVFSVGAMAGSHLQNVDTEYNYSEVNNPQVEYGDVVALFGEGDEQIDADDNYVVVNDNSNLPEDSNGLLTGPNGNLVVLNNTFDNNGRTELRFGTQQTFGVYDEDPRGDFTVRGLSAGGELAVPNQTQGAGGTNSLAVDISDVPIEPSGPDNYAVVVTDSDGNVLNGDNFDPNTSGDGTDGNADALVVPSGERYEEILIPLNQSVPSEVNVYLKEVPDSDVQDGNSNPDRIVQKPTDGLMSLDNVTEEQVQNGNLVRVPIEQEGVVVNGSQDDPTASGDYNRIDDETSVDSQVDGFDVVAPWELVSAFAQGNGAGTANGDADPDPGESKLNGLDRDTRIFVDFLDENSPTADSTETTQTVEAGQKIVISGNLDDPGVSESNEYLVEKVVQNDTNQIVTELALDGSETVNQREVLINTSYPDTGSDIEPDGRFRLVTDGGDTELARWRATQQEFNAQFLNNEGQDGFVNLNTEDTTTQLNVSGTRIDYDIIVGANQQLNAQELQQIFASAEGFSPETVDYDADDDEAYFIRLNNIAQSGTSQNITADFADQDAQEYNFNVSVADNAVQDNATVEVVFGTTGDADFNRGNYNISRGDTVEMNLTLEDTEVAEFGFDEPDKYDIDFRVEDTDDDGNVSIKFDTYRVDEFQTREVTEVFNVTSGQLVSPDDVELPQVSEDGLSTGVYRLEAFVDGEPTDVASLNVRARDTESIQTLVLPNANVIDSNRDLDLEEIRENATEQESIAFGDVLVLRMQISGIYSDSLVNDSTEGTVFVNNSRRSEEIKNYDDPADEPQVDPADVLDEINLRIEGEPSPNKPAPEFRFENAENLVVDSQNETMYVLFRTDENETYTSLDGNFLTDLDGERDSINRDDVTTEYTVYANLTEDYKFTEDGTRNLTDEFEMVNRTVRPSNLNNIVTDPQELETKYSLPARDNETIEAETNIAPGSELQIRVTSEGLNPYRTVEDAVVQQGEEINTVNSTFNFSSLEPGRNMSIRFFPLDEQEREAQIVEPPEPPEIESVNVSTPVTVGESAEFSVNVTNTQGSAIQYEWDFDDNETSGLANPVHVYDEPGTYNVSLVVTNSNNGLTDNETIDVFVEETPNQPPTVDELIGPSEVDVGESAQYGVLASDDGPSDELQYQWTFGNGNSGTGPTATNTYTAEGVYTVQINVTDAEGEQTSASRTVQVGRGEDGGEDNTGDVTLNGTVQDATNQQPIPGATVAVDDLSTQTSPDTGDSTDDSGQLSLELSQSNYTVSVRAQGYQETTESLELTGDDTLTVQMQPSQGGTDNGSNNSSDDPDQPGFTLLLGALVLIVAGAYLYYRREIAVSSHPVK